MATFSATTSNVGIDMGNLPYFNGSTSFSNNHILVSVGTYPYSEVQTQDYYGSFALSPSGTVTGNVISTYYTSSTGKKYQFTDFSTDATTAFDLINKRQISQLESIILSGDDIIKGTFYNDILYGFNGDDVFSGGPGSDTFDGGAGIDILALTGTRAKSTITKFNTTGVIVPSSGVEGTDYFYNVERIWFDDVVVAFDTSGNAGQAYRLYQAALGRAPDKSGLGYHINSLDSGHTLTTVAQGFVDSIEFKGKYGSLSNSQFVTQLYQNILHRGPDAGGLSFHVSSLEAGATRAQVLVSFSESTENQTALIGVMQNGIEYIPV